MSERRARCLWPSWPVFAVLQAAHPLQIVPSWLHWHSDSPSIPWFGWEHAGGACGWCMVLACIHVYVCSLACTACNVGFVFTYCWTISNGTISFQLHFYVWGSLDLCVAVSLDLRVLTFLFLKCKYCHSRPFLSLVSTKQKRLRDDKLKQ